MAPTSSRLGGSGLRARYSRPAFLLLGVLSLAAPAAFGGISEEEEILLPGQARERALAGGEAHIYRVEVADAPLLITVEQRGIDLVMEARGIAGQSPLTVDSLNGRWGPEILLLESAGRYSIKIRTGQDAASSAGRYVIAAAALPATAEGGRRRAAAAAMVRGGQLAALAGPESLGRAVTAYKEALETWRSLEDRGWEAEALFAIAALEQQRGELRLAAEGFSQALGLWRELGEPRREAQTSNRLALIRWRSGESEAARTELHTALDLWQRLGERLDETETRINLCLVEQTSGSLPAALRCYQEAHALYHDLGNRSGEATILNNLGGVYDLLGQPDAALDHYEQALELRRALADRQGEAQTLNNIAVIHRVLGEWQEALRVFGQAREILAPLGDRLQEAALLNNVGLTYESLGEPQRALPFLKDALQLRQQTGDRRGEILTLNNLGGVWRKLGDLNKAFDSHRRALELATVLQDRRLEAGSRLYLGEAQLDRGDAVTALREIEPALDYFQTVGNRSYEAQALDLRGRAIRSAGRPQEAMPVLQAALTLHRALRDRAGEAEALQALAAAERSLGLANEARAHAEEAVARVEELRTGFVSPDLRAAFLATQRRAYSLQIDLLMDWNAADPNGHHDRAALEISEQARARSLLDALYSGNAIRPGSTVPAELLERRRSLRYRLNMKADQQLRKSGAGEERTEAQEREIEALLTELDSVEAEIRRLDPLYAAVSKPHSLGVEDIARMLDPGTLLLEYSLGEERSYLWEIGTGSFRSFLLPPQRKIEALARQLYGELSTLAAGAGRGSGAAQALGRILLGKVWSDAVAHHRLVVVSDAALHLVPFGALPAPDSGAPLLEKFEIAYLPSTTTLAIQRQRLEHRSPASKWAAVFADPVFASNDPRLTGSSITRRTAAAKPSVRGTPDEAPFVALERLPATRREAAAITAQAPAGQVWTARDLAANRKAVLSGGLRDYRVVHFATHAVADTHNPELSGLVLSLVDAAGRPQQGFLGLSDIYELDLNADLVVLSGCRTAFGKEVRGEGLVGLTRGFLYAGVPRVVASLWRVQDRATEVLMTHFYRALWHDRLPSAAALRKAQLLLRRDPKYRSPYSWAGFVLQGDWH